MGGKYHDINTAAALNGYTSFCLGGNDKEGCRTYKERLSPWCIIRHLPNLQRIVVARFRRRNNAEDHLRLLRQMIPHVAYSIVFDPMLDNDDAIANSKQPIDIKFG